MRARSPSRPATSRPASGESPRSRSSSPSARSFPGPSRRSARSPHRRTRIRATARKGSSYCGRASSAEEVVERLTEADEGREHRQLGVVDAEGRGATYTGSECMDWAGGRPERAMRPRATSSSPARLSMRSRRRSSRARGRSRSACSIAWRRRRPPEATRAASSPRRSSWWRRTAATRACPTSLIDLRVDDHERPIEELRRLYGLHRQLFGKTPRGRTGSRSTRSSAPRSGSGWRGSGTRAWPSWAGVENLEERVAGDDAVDPVVLEELRRQSG